MNKLLTFPCFYEAVKVYFHDVLQFRGSDEKAQQFVTGGEDEVYFHPL